MLQRGPCQLFPKGLGPIRGQRLVAYPALPKGTWAEYIGGLVDRIPQKLGTLGRYAMITDDTALYKGMSRAVQYGDP